MTNSLLLALRNGEYCFNITITLHAFNYFFAFVSCWPSVVIRRIIYKFFNVCLFNFIIFAVSGKVRIPLTDLI